MPKYFSFLMVVLLLALACKNQHEQQDIDSLENTLVYNYNEPYRPQFHFSPPEKWMNDPNGLVFHQETYHLFYQYYPEDIVWGPMHWGHATSKDLISWEHQPIALYPDELGYIFSGSAVVDHQNSSGFGTLDNPPLVAIYTYHLDEGEKAGRNDFQTQGIAYSLDNGTTWKTYEGNPVIGNPTSIRDFRDPKVFWDTEQERWVMALVAGDHVKFYASENLKQWSLLSEFGKDQGAHGGVWECPDLFKLKVAGTDEEKWVLLVSINPGAPNGGSGTQYFVGDFDGTKFTPTGPHQWIDLGRDNYAGVTYNNVPNPTDRLFIGWMSNWDYAQKTPTENWRSSMTLPRNITLHQEGDRYFIKSYPLAALSKLQTESDELAEISLEQAFEVFKDNFNQYDITLETDLSKPLSVIFSNEASEQFSFTFNPEEKFMYFDRTKAGMSSFSEKFGPKVQQQHYQPTSKISEVRIILDASSVEIFVDKGRYIFTNQVFPTQPYTKLSITGDTSSSIQNLKLHQLTSIWNSDE